jgi:SOS response regulatory protein OraA/RecX
MSKEQMENILAHKIELKIFKCETMKDVEDVDKLIITLKKNGHPMELIQYLWRQLDEKQV